MPLLWEIEGVWWSVVASDILAFAVSMAFIIAMRKKYGY
jgi:Na+-driven multidrug efflux pump